MGSLLAPEPDHLRLAVRGDALSHDAREARHRALGRRGVRAMIEAVEVDLVTLRLQVAEVCRERGVVEDRRATVVVGHDEKRGACANAVAQGDGGVDLAGPHRGNVVDGDVGGHRALTG